jgi:hypothetical protein
MLATKDRCYAVSYLNCGEWHGIAHHGRCLALERSTLPDGALLTRATTGSNQSEMNIVYILFICGAVLGKYVRNVGRQAQIIPIPSCKVSQKTVVLGFVVR